MVSERRQGGLLFWKRGDPLYKRHIQRDSGTNIFQTYYRLSFAAAGSCKRDSSKCSCYQPEWRYIKSMCYLFLMFNYAYRCSPPCVPRTKTCHFPSYPLKIFFSTNASSNKHIKLSIYFYVILVIIVW